MFGPNEFVRIETERLRNETSARIYSITLKELLVRFRNPVEKADPTDVMGVGTENFRRLR